MYLNKITRWNVLSLNGNWTLTWDVFKFLYFKQQLILL